MIMTGDSRPSRYSIALELCRGESSATERLNEAAAAHLAALKSELTPKRETALRLLARGEGSAKAIIDILKPVPSLLDIVRLPLTPRIQAIRELVQIENSPPEWDGFHDRYWTTGQMVLWAITADRWAVDQASNDSGRLGDDWGQHKAKLVFDALNIPRERIQRAANELWRQCLSGSVKAIGDQGQPIPPNDWLGLKIMLRMENTLCVLRRQQSSEPSCQGVLFSRADEDAEPHGEGQSQLSAVSPGGAPNKEVHIDVEPYIIDRENPNDSPQLKIARFAALKRWAMGILRSRRLGYPEGRLPKLKRHWI
jgi:hypothetical protein